MILTVNTETPYPVHLGHDLFLQLEKYINFSGAQVAFLVDSKLSSLVTDCFSDHLIIPIDLKEEKKDLVTYEKIIDILRQNNFSRYDWLVNVGGGTISDLGGFVSSTYKRGIRHINIATTILSQVDASLGGKNGLDLWQTKNLVGTIYQPQMVIIDFDFLKTLPPRQINNGLYEALKLALLYDLDLLALLEAEDYLDHIEEITLSAVKLKIAVVEEDEFDNNTRRVLNYGHTIGHALESSCEDLLHGEAIMYGMMIMCEKKELVNRLKAIAKRWQLPSLPSLDHKKLNKALLNDKKNLGTDAFTLIALKEEQDWEIRQITFRTLRQRINNYEQSNR